jgi:hypothetical protein
MLMAVLSDRRACGCGSARGTGESGPGVDDGCISGCPPRPRAASGQAAQERSRWAQPDLHTVKIRGVQAKRRGVRNPGTPGQHGPCAVFVSQRPEDAAVNARLARGSSLSWPLMTRASSGADGSSGSRSCGRRPSGNWRVCRRGASAKAWGGSGGRMRSSHHDSPKTVPRRTNGNTGTRISTYIGDACRRVRITPTGWRAVPAMGRSLGSAEGSVLPGARAASPTVVVVFSIAQRRTGHCSAADAMLRAGRGRRARSPRTLGRRACSGRAVGTTLCTAAPAPGSETIRPVREGTRWLQASGPPARIFQVASRATPFQRPGGGCQACG